MFALLGFKENRKFLKLKKKKEMKKPHAALFRFQTIVIPEVKGSSWWCTVFRVK